MRRIILLTFIALSLFAGSSLAESINGRLGMTGKVGVIVPVEDSDIKGINFDMDTGFAGGGGLIYGFTDNFAAELDVTHAPSLDAKIAGTAVGDAQFTDISLGVLFRFMPEQRLVPYVGLGGDAIKGDIEDSTLDWTYGGHVNAGVDFFLNKSIALNLDFRGVFADKGDIKQNGVTVGKFDPMSFVGTVGVRLFLPKY